MLPLPALNREADVLAIWQAHLPQAHFVVFRQWARVAEIVNIISQYARPKAKLLDIGSGPMALPCYLEMLGFQDIIALDFNRAYGEIYRQLREAQILTHTRFVVGDANNLCFKNAGCDMLVAHDILFAPQIRLEELLRGGYAALKPGGFFYFDVWDATFTRFAPLYRRLGFARYDNYQRYDMAEIGDMLKRTGFCVVEQRTVFGHKQAQRIVRLILWVLFGIANRRCFVVQKFI